MGTVTVDSHTHHYVASILHRDGRHMVADIRNMLTAWAWPSEAAHFHRVMNERAECNLQLLGCTTWEDL